MSDETMLAVVPETALEFFAEGHGADVLIGAVREKALALMPAEMNLTTAKGRAEIKSVAYKVTRTKTAIDAARKELVAKYKEIPKRIDATGKRIKDELEAIAAEILAPVTEYEEKEKARTSAIQFRIDQIRDSGGVKLDTAKELLACIDAIHAIEVDETFEEFQGQAALVKDAVLNRLRERHAAALNQEGLEKEAAEKKALALAEAAKVAAEKEAARKTEVERAQAEAAIAQAKLAQEKAERAAEQAKLDAEKKALEAVEAEKKRVADEAAEAMALEEARTLDAQHRYTIHSEIYDDLMALNLPGDMSELVLDTLRDGKIRNVKIQY